MTKKGNGVKVTLAVLGEKIENLHTDIRVMREENKQIQDKTEKRREESDKIHDKVKIHDYVLKISTPILIAILSALCIKIFYLG